MSACEVLQMIIDKNNGDVESTILDTNDLIDEIGHCNFTYKLSDELESYCLSKNICPLCGNELITNEYEEHRGEYFGFNTYERMDRTECTTTSCPFTIE